MKKSNSNSLRKRNGFVVTVVVSVGLFVLVGGLTLTTVLLSGEPGCQSALAKDPFSAYSQTDFETLQNCREAQARQAEILGAGGSMASAASPGTSPKDAIAAWGPGIADKIRERFDQPVAVESNPLPGDPPTDDDDDDATGDTLCEKTISNLDRCGLLAGSSLGPNPEDAVWSCNYFIEEHPLADELRCNFQCMSEFPDCSDQVDRAIIDLCDDQCSP